MTGKSELFKYGVRLSEVRSVVSDGATGAVIYTASSATIVDGADAVSTIVAYLRANYVPIYGLDEDVPFVHAPDGDNVIVSS